MKWSLSSRRLRCAKLVSVLSACAAVVAISVPSEVKAEESSYCKKVHARTTGDAALLFAPTIQAQAIRYPTGAGGTIDAGTTSGTGLQARASVSWSPLDFYRGFGVMSAGDADCARGDAQIIAQRLLHYGEDYGRLHARRSQVSYFASRESAIALLLAKSDERLAAHVTSLLDTNELRARAADLDRKRVIAQAEVARLEARGVESYGGDIRRLAVEVEAKSVRYEREVSALRKLDGWDLRLSGGVIPHDTPQVFGFVQLGFNVGSIARIVSESSYMDARTEELRKARYELRDQLERFKAQLRTARAQAIGESAIVSSRVASLVAARQALAGSDSPNAPHVLAVLDLEIIGAEADNAFLNSLISELSNLEENHHGK